LNYSGQPYNGSERRRGVPFFYIAGGNKVAPLQKAGGNGLPQGNNLNPNLAKPSVYNGQNSIAAK
jgi:hypothetical protein